MLIIFALAMFALLMIVALAVDLGQARFSKREEQAAADLAALDAGYYLSGRGSAGTPVSQPAAACVAAVQSVQRNVDGFQPMFDEATITSRCSTLAATAASCSAATTPVNVDFEAGDYFLRVRYPVPTSELDTTGFAGGTGVQDGTDQCERMRVSLAKTDEASFSAVGGFDGIDTESDAVVRASTSSTQNAVAALLLLERVGCGALQTSGGGGSGAGVYVQKSSNTVPGIIAADSAGQVPPCTTNNNANGWVIYGTALPEAGGGGPSITAEAANASTPGIISIYANSVGGRGGYTAPTGLNVAPTGGTIASRSVADERYNGVNGQLSTLHATAYSASESAPAGWTILSGSSECKGAVPAEKADATQILVDCSTFEPDVNIFPNATDFVVRGNVSIKSNKTLSLPVVRRIFVRGCSIGGCGGSNTFAVDVANNGSLLINTGDVTIPNPTTGGTSCAGRKGPGDGGTVTNTTRFAMLGGSFTVSGFARMCQTTVYVGEAGTTAYTKRTQSLNGSAPENYPTVAQCSSDRPCPKDDAAPLSFISFGGGSGTADWSAPNQIDARPTTGQLAYDQQPFEDLALWTETSTGSDIKGQGLNSTEGVFFLPNASFTFTGQGTQTQPLNAQFLSRRLNVSGQGSLVMRPDPNDSLEVAVVGAIALIR